MRPRMKKAGWLGVRWGAAVSALLHLGVAAAILLVLPEPKMPKAKPLEVPVEIVRPLEKKPEKKKPAKKLAEKKPSAAAKAKPKPAAKEPKKPAPKEPRKEAKPKPPEKPKEPEKQKPLLAEKVKPKPPPEPKKAAPKIAEPVKEPPLVPKEKKPKPPEPKPIPKKVEKQLAGKPAKAKPKGGGRKVEPNPQSDTQISMIQRKLVGRWILQPLEVNLKHRCGRASISGVIDLTRKRGNRFYGSLRTTIRWARCPPEGAVYQIELLIRGDRVVMRDAGGVLDRGLIRGNIMVLKDAYGRSVWRRSK